MRAPQLPMVREKPGWGTQWGPGPWRRLLFQSLGGGSTFEELAPPNGL